jgi:hypothetical protein
MVEDDSQRTMNIYTQFLSCTLYVDIISERLKYWIPRYGWDVEGTPINYERRV